MNLAIELTHLVELQKLDRKLDDIENAKGDLPNRVRASEQRLADLKADIEVRAQNLQLTQKEKRRLEGEIAVLEQKKKDLSEKLYAVTTNKEYDAVTLEIETVLQRIDETETTLLQAIEREDQLESELSELRSQLTSQEETHNKQMADLQRRIETNAEKERLLRGERDSLAEKIPLPRLRTYTRIRNGKDGLAVVPILRGACGGCYTNIPPQRIMEVRDHDKIITCESCGRILYWVEQNETADAVSQ